MTGPESARKGLAVPRSSRADRVRTLLSGAIGMAPGVGSLASAIMEAIWRPAYEKRVETFAEMVVAELTKLDDRIDNIEELLQRDVAISIGIAGARAAGKTHDECKLRYLTNAVVGVTIEPTWDAKADFASLLLQLVDDLSVTHIRVLKGMSDVVTWAEPFSGRQLDTNTSREILEAAFPDIDSVVLQAIFADLTARNLVQHVAAWDGTPLPSPAGLTDLGRALLQFIATSPSTPDE